MLVQRRRGSARRSSAALGGGSAGQRSATGSGTHARRRAPRGPSQPMSSRAASRTPRRDVVDELGRVVGVHGDVEQARRRRRRRPCRPLGGLQRGAGASAARPGRSTLGVERSVRPGPVAHEPLTPKIARCRKPPAEAHHRAVHVEHPLVLLDRRAHHLDEVRGRQLLRALRRSACGCARSAGARTPGPGTASACGRPPPRPTDARMVSYSRVAHRDAHGGARRARSRRRSPGRSASSSICRVRSPRGPSSRKLPMFSSVTTSSAMICA